MRTTTTVRPPRYPGELRVRVMSMVRYITIRLFPCICTTKFLTKKANRLERTGRAVYNPPSPPRAQHVERLRPRVSKQCAACRNRQPQHSVALHPATPRAGRPGCAPEHTDAIRTRVDMSMSMSMSINVRMCADAYTCTYDYMREPRALSLSRERARRRGA